MTDTDPDMVPAGYLLKRILSRPDWLGAPSVVDICSVADCVNDDVVDIEAIWEHNSFGVASDPELLWRLAREGQVDTSEARLFYYEAYAWETELEGLLEPPPVQWRPLSPVPSGKTEASAVVVPSHKRLMGYDVVASEDYLEHSPLSCNSVAQAVSVNAHCLFNTLEQARQAIEDGHFNNCEPGVYRIYAVYRVDTDPVEAGV